MTDHSEQPVIIYSQGQKMLADLSVPERGAPVVVMSHGFESSKDGTKWRALATRLGEAGFAGLRFSYRGCGEGGEISDGDFADTTLTGRIADYRAAVDFLEGTDVDTSKIGVIGSSFGGMVALAAGDNRIRAMVTLATPVHLSSPGVKELKDIRERGYSELNSGRKLNVGFYDDMQHFNLPEGIKVIECPLLVVHGGRDEVVQVRDANIIYSLAHGPKRIEIIDGADHSFGSPEHRDRVLKLALEWFRTYLAV